MGRRAAWVLVRGDLIILIQQHPLHRRSKEARRPLYVTYRLRMEHFYLRPPPRSDFKVGVWRPTVNLFEYAFRLVEKLEHPKRILEIALKQNLSTFSLKSGAELFQLWISRFLAKVRLSLFTHPCPVHSVSSTSISLSQHQP